MRTTTDTTTAADEGLRQAAVAGDRTSFAELHRRHGPVAWHLALAVAGDPDLASSAVVHATGQVFTALRAGRFQPHGHGIALAVAARNAALDLRRSGVRTSTAVADDADAVVSAAFHGLPERWRSVLWLRDAEGMDAAVAAPIVELDPEGVDQLAVRARRGLRQRYLRAMVAEASGRNCTRAVSRLGALDEGTLRARDAANLERHLGVCAGCSDRRDRVAGLGAALPALAMAMPSDLEERAAGAWTSALASSTHTGLSPRTEKILAGASAFAAALGVLGAALFGSGGGDDPVASPLAPLVADIETPRPVDLSDLLAPITSPTPPARPTPAAADAAAARTGTTPTAAPSGTEVAAPATPQAPATSSDETPAAEAPRRPLGDLPIDVSIDLDSGITVGPITVDPTPEGGPVLGVEAPEQLAPVTDPVFDVVNQLATPVLEATQPVVAPLAEVIKPVTDAVNRVVDGLGL